ncbi:hypothetical protein NUW58_g438 [Xylaria curta]|uniref:Uncharacterized protein n=1 Tax=Xylaria curta TaxID=42375 RepID=A0ACC1PQV6_9PEZI|nr:hypothetical protein NUW58_g438 [Xylaria curta]
MSRYWMAVPWLAETAPQGSSPRAMAAGAVLDGVRSGRGFAITSPKGAKAVLVSGAAAIVSDSVTGVVRTSMIMDDGDGAVDTLSSISFSIGPPYPASAQISMSTAYLPKVFTTSVGL